MNDQKSSAARKQPEKWLVLLWPKNLRTILPSLLAAEKSRELFRRRLLTKHLLSHVRILAVRVFDGL